MKEKKRLIAGVACICMTAVILSGCANIVANGSGGAATVEIVSGDKAVSGPSSKDGEGVKVSDADRKAADEFDSKVKINKGIGDFEMSAVKLPGSVGGFLLWFTNKNDFPASALIEVLYKKADGSMVFASTRETSVLVSQARILLDIIPDDDLLADGYDSVEITAYAREKTKNTMRMVDDVDASKVKISTGDVESGGMFDGLHKVDVSILASKALVGDLYALFYDVDGYLVTANPHWTGDDRKYRAYSDMPFDHCEIMITKLIDDVPDLPDSIYEAYKSAGYKTEIGKTYTSPDGYVDYDFMETSDGTILLHAVNKCDRRISWYVNDIIDYTGAWSCHTNYLNLDAGGEIYWDLAIKPGSTFWLMEPVAYYTEVNPVTPPEITIEETDDGRKIVADATASVNSLPEGYNNTIKVSCTVVYYQGADKTGAEYMTFSDEMFCYGLKDERQLKYEGDYDSYEIYMQYEPSCYMEPGI